MQSFNIVFDTLNELSLILADRSTNVRPHKQRVEAGEYAKHLVGVLSCAQLVSEVRRDAGLYAIYK